MTYMTIYDLYDTTHRRCVCGGFAFIVSREKSGGLDRAGEPAGDRSSRPGRAGGPRFVRGCWTIATVEKSCPGALQLKFSGFFVTLVELAARRS